MSDLKPCPFCGGEMFLSYHSGDNAFHVFHKSSLAAIHCPILEPFLVTELDDMSLNGAKEAWNRRANDDRP